MNMKHKQEVEHFSAIFVVVIFQSQLLRTVVNHMFEKNNRIMNKKWNEKTEKNEETKKKVNKHQTHTQREERENFPLLWNYYSIWLSHSNCLTFVRWLSKRWRPRKKAHVHTHKTLACDFFSLHSFGYRY